MALYYTRLKKKYPDGRVKIITSNYWNTRNCVAYNLDKELVAPFMDSSNNPTIKSSDAAKQIKDILIKRGETEFSLVLTRRDIRYKEVKLPDGTIRKFRKGYKYVVVDNDSIHLQNLSSILMNCFPIYWRKFIEKDKPNYIESAIGERINMRTVKF